MHVCKTYELGQMCQLLNGPSHTCVPFFLFVLLKSLLLGKITVISGMVLCSTLPQDGTVNIWAVRSIIQQSKSHIHHFNIRVVHCRDKIWTVELLNRQFRCAQHTAKNLPRVSGFPPFDPNWHSLLQSYSGEIDY